MNRRWVCTDIWMDMFPFFDRLQLGLNLALLSPRFDILVEKHFDGTSELPILKDIVLRKNKVTAVPELCVFMDNANYVPFSLPDYSLPKKIRFKHLQIYYIDHSVIAFIRANQQMFDKGTNLEFFSVSWNETFFAQPIWNALIHHVLPIFAPKIHQLKFPSADQLYWLLRFTSPKVLSDLNIHSIDAGRLFPNAIDSGAELLDEICGDSDQPLAYSAGQILSEWLHIPAKDGQPKKLRCHAFTSEIVDLVNNFKKKFRRATTSSASYQIQFTVHMPTEIAPFQLMNERTNEILTLEKEENNDENMDDEDDDNEWDKRWIMKRCQIGETTAVLNENSGNLNMNNISFSFYGNCIGRLSPPSEEEEAGQSAGKESTERKLDISIPPLNEFKGAPSYSAAAFVAMMSISTGRTIKTNWTVTGEVTINGHVEAIGGVRAKTLAAIRVGMTTIVLPRGNLGDFRRIEKKHRRITAIFVDHTFDLLQMLN
ncbi:hypothetical protein niasHT_011195 [Heterodera trifolii]|uniref:Lon proteolytic domain-containing protein n=1 Tax=Heterodera trifolii TaxID=157864 RepID=A0ABD2LD25_9BILA